MALPLLVLQVARFLSDADYCLLSTEVNAIISALKVAHRTAGLTGSQRFPQEEPWVWSE